MSLQLEVERLVDERVRRLLADHVCECPCRSRPEPIGDGSSLADRVWMTTAEAAEYTRRSVATIGQHASAETLRSTQAGRGRGRRYRREWLDEWLLKAPRLGATAGR